MPNKNILFLDIETVAQQENFQALSPTAKALWEKKTEWMRRAGDTPEAFYLKRGAIFAEFSKVICVCVAALTGGLQTGEGEAELLKMKSFFGTEEKPLLEKFTALLNRKPAYLLCAHNGKEFDFPVLARRLLANGLTLPPQLQLQGKKPWEVPHLDTLELWKFGDYKHFTSLELLAHTLQLPEPKLKPPGGEALDGSKIHEVFYKEKNLDKIAAYCQRDVFTLVNVYLKMQGQSALTEDQLQLV